MPNRIVGLTFVGIGSIIKLMVMRGHKKRGGLSLFLFCGAVCAVAGCGADWAIFFLGDVRVPAVGKLALPGELEPGVFWAGVAKVDATMPVGVHLAGFGGGLYRSIWGIFRAILSTLTLVPNVLSLSCMSRVMSIPDGSWSPR